MCRATSCGQCPQESVQALAEEEIKAAWGSRGSVTDEMDASLARAFLLVTNVCVCYQSNKF